MRVTRVTSPVLTTSAPQVCLRVTRVTSPVLTTSAPTGLRACHTSNSSRSDHIGANRFVCVPHKQPEGDSLNRSTGDSSRRRGCVNNIGSVGDNRSRCDEVVQDGGPHSRTEAIGGVGCPAAAEATSRCTSCSSYSYNLDLAPDPNPTGASICWSTSRYRSRFEKQQIQIHPYVHFF